MVEGRGRGKKRSGKYKFAKLLALHRSFQLNYSRNKRFEVYETNGVKIIMTLFRKLFSDIRAHRMIFPPLAPPSYYRFIL